MQQSFVPICGFSYPIRMLASNIIGASNTYSPEWISQFYFKEINDKRRSYSYNRSPRTQINIYSKERNLNLILSPNYNRYSLIDIFHFARVQGVISPSNFCPWYFLNNPFADNQEINVNYISTHAPTITYMAEYYAPGTSGLSARQILRNASDIESLARSPHNGKWSIKATVTNEFNISSESFCGHVEWANGVGPNTCGRGNFCGRPVRVFPQGTSAPYPRFCCNLVRQNLSLGEIRFLSGPPPASQGSLLKGLT